jgi:hypothetical protein
VVDLMHVMMRGVDHDTGPHLKAGAVSEFSKLIRDDPSVPANLRGFVSRAYAFKTIADVALMSS